MQRLYLPPSLSYLDPMRVVPKQPIAHASFMYDLIAVLRPELIVDVGAGAGIAFSIACQSMRDHEVDGLAYAVDSWADDDGKAEEDPTRWTALNGFLRAYFRGVAYLMKMEPAEALQHFPDGSIGVLRLNAARSGATLWALIEAWLPRLAPGGALLCPGVADPERADLADDWKRATSDRGAFVFPHGKGLGVLQRRPDHDAGPVPELVQLVTSTDAADREGIARFYEHADRHHEFRAEVQDKWTELARKK